MMYGEWQCPVSIYLYVVSTWSRSLSTRGCAILHVFLIDVTGGSLQSPQCQTLSLSLLDVCALMTSSVPVLSLGILAVFAPHFPQHTHNMCTSDLSA